MVSKTQGWALTLACTITVPYFCPAVWSSVPCQETCAGQREASYIYRDHKLFIKLRLNPPFKASKTLTHLALEKELVLLKRVKRICSPLEECLYKAGRELFQKEKNLSYWIYSSSLNCYSINQCNTKEKNTLPSPIFLLNFPQTYNLGRNGRNLKETLTILLCRPL